ncbi:kinase, partial [Enterococcus faecium]
ALKNIIADRKKDKFKLGTLYDFDLKDYTQVDYTPQLHKLQKQINDKK